jgi:hypothetical protein
MAVKIMKHMGIMGERMRGRRRGMEVGEAEYDLPSRDLTISMDRSR